MSEYLAKAGEAISREPQRWRKKQQERLKGNQVGKVLAELRGQLEEEEDEPAPVRACWRYLSNRLENLDYQGAIAAGLPIGSGEVERQSECDPGAAQAQWSMVESGECGNDVGVADAAGEWAVGIILEGFTSSGGLILSPTLNCTPLEARAGLIAQSGTQALLIVLSPLKRRSFVASERS